MATSIRAIPHPEIGTELVRDWEPSGGPKANIVLVHGLAEHSGRYERTGSLLSEAGFWVRGFDLMGAGGSGGRRWDIDDWTRYHEQIESHVGWAANSGNPVVLMGHSLGGALTLGYALSDRPQPDLLVLSAPALGGAAGWQKALAPVVGKLIPKVSIPNPVNGEHLSRDPAVAEAYFSDPLVVTRSTARFGAQLIREIDRLKEALWRLEVPTLVIHGGDDVLVPVSTSEPLGLLDICDRRVYDGLRHETLNEPEGPEVVADIVDWLNSRLSAI